MTGNLSTWKFIKSNQDADSEVVLLYVMQSIGSSPGREGFCMAVNAKGEMAGSVGGGIMEHKFVEMAKEMLKDRSAEISIHRQIHDKSAPKQQSGMICSGEQTILIYPVQKTDAIGINKLIETLNGNKSGQIFLQTSGISFQVNEIKKDSKLEILSETDWHFESSVGFQPHIHIVGGGHCALALSKMMAMLDFYIHLYEDRPGLNTFEANVFAHEKILVSDYKQLENLIPENAHDFVVIMTFGYRTDDLAVRSLKQRKFKFLGVLGSKKKIEKMMSEYKLDGFDQNWLSSLAAPVGLPIKSQTPEEIAVSIAAQIVGFRNGV